MVTHLRATERRLPYAITQYYLPPSQTGQYSIYLTLWEWKAELTLVVGYIYMYIEIVYKSADKTVTHPSNNQRSNQESNPRPIDQRHNRYASKPP